MATTTAKLRIVLNGKGEAETAKILAALGARTIEDIKEADHDRAMTLAGRADLCRGAVEAHADAEHTDNRDEEPVSLASAAACASSVPAKINAIGDAYWNKRKAIDAVKDEVRGDDPANRHAR
jgi:hypothetical protein